MSATTRTASIKKKEKRFSTIALERVTKALGSFEDDACYAADEADGRKVPPADRGKKALLFMCSAFAIEAIMWGTFFLFFCSVGLQLASIYFRRAGRRLKSPYWRFGMCDQGRCHVVSSVPES
jgi:hypothetical protein